MFITQSGLPDGVVKGRILIINNNKLFILALLFTSFINLVLISLVSLNYFIIYPYYNH